MSFDLLAPHYHWMEALLAGGKLQRCRTAFLDRVTGCRNVLICGEGNGRFLVECRRKLASAKVTCVDASRAMLERAARRLQRSGLGLDGVEMICADAREWNDPGDSGRFDLVVTHFFLDCFDLAELRALMARLARLATPASAWMIADFRVPSAGPARVRALLMHKLMYCFFRRVTGISGAQVVLPDPWFEQHGFRLAAGISSEWGLLRSELWVRGGFQTCSPLLVGTSRTASHARR